MSSSAQIGTALRRYYERETRVCSAPVRASLLVTFLLPALLPAATVVYDQQSAPLGLYSHSQTVESGIEVTTLTVRQSTNGYHFTHWEINGVRTNDLLGLGISPVTFRILQNTTATCHHVSSTLDADADGVPDWYELHLLSNTNAPAAADSDADGFDLAEEYRRDYHPNLTNELTDGGFSLVLSPPTRVVLDGNLLTYLERSDPLGLRTERNDVFTNGTPITITDTYGTVSGYAFCYWTTNGFVKTDVNGRALSRFNFVLRTNTFAEAHYVPSGQDADADGLADWLELNYFGTTNQVASSDTDGDGFDLAEELRRDYHPNVVNEIADGGFSLVLAPPMRVIANTNLVVYTKASNPEGIFATTEQILPRGTTNTIGETYGAGPNGPTYAFCYWTLNGAAQTDVAGRALSRFTFVIQSNTIAEALYVPYNDDKDLDDIKDWLEYNYFGTTNVAADADSDGDGFDLAEELRRDYHPNVVNELADGGFSLVLSPPARVIGNTNLAVYTKRSEPEGIFATTEQVLPRGTPIEVAPVYGASSGYSFAFWTLNGQEQRDVAGRALSGFSFLFAGNAIAEARYFPSSQDADADGLADWLEYNFYGTTNFDGAFDGDDDGFDLAEELRRDYHPNVVNEIADGGFSLVLSPPMTVNLEFHPRIADGLLNGAPAELFSISTPSVGDLALPANSHPAVGDWDGDGDLDVFVGGSNGVMRIFENAGSPRVMNLVERTTNFAAIAFAWTNAVNPAPALGDFTGDGCADLAVGGGPDGVWLVESPGVFQDVSAPSFVVNFVVNLHGIDEVHDKVYDEVGKGGEVGNALTGALQTNLHAIAGIPTFGDVDGDGWQDLLILTADGTVSLYSHTRIPTSPYTAPPATTDLLNYTVPNATGITTGDVNEDGVIDVLISDEKGNVWEFHGVTP